MLLDITNTCRMGCPHCLQRATPEPQHMTDETFKLAKAFIWRFGVKYVLISGGEPTEHPKWLQYVDEVANMPGVNVIIPTNGMFIGNDNESAMCYLLSIHRNIVVQITTVKGLYPRHDETLAKIEEFKQHLKMRGLRHRIVVADEIEGMVELGRCCDHPELAEIARKCPYGTTSCFQAALVSAQTVLPDAITALERRGKLCHPLIDWQGGMHWSESWLCPAFASVHDSWGDVCMKAHEWRPCGKCAGYKKLLNRKDPRYAMAREILGIKEANDG